MWLGSGARGLCRSLQFSHTAYILVSLSFSLSLAHKNTHTQSVALFSLLRGSDGDAHQAVLRHLRVRVVVMSFESERACRDFDVCLCALVRNSSTVARPARRSPSTYTS